MLNEELDKLSGQRARQIWNRVDVRNKFQLCINVPGVRSMITVGALEGLLKLRMSDVSIRPYIITDFQL
jgi:hypothetical protein